MVTERKGEGGKERDVTKGRFPQLCVLAHTCVASKISKDYTFLVFGEFTDQLEIHRTVKKSVCFFHKMGPLINLLGFLMLDFPSM